MIQSLPFQAAGGFLSPQGEKVAHAHTAVLLHHRHQVEERHLGFGRQPATEFSLAGSAQADQGDAAAVAFTETVFIEVDERREEFASSLVSRGLRCSVDGTSVVVEEVDEEAYDAIRDALVESGAPLRRMAPRRRALAEIFRPTGDGATPPGEVDQ